MAASKNNDMYSYLDQLSTQELESLLQKDAEAPDGGDLDMVMYIMEVIEKREGGSDKEKPLPLWKIFSLRMQRRRARDFSCIPVARQKAYMYH